MSRVKPFQNYGEFIQIIQIFARIWKYGGLYPLIHVTGVTLKTYRSSWRISINWVLWLSQIIIVVIKLDWDEEKMDRLLVGIYQLAYACNFFITAITFHQVAQTITASLKESQSIFEELEALAEMTLIIRDPYRLIAEFLAVHTCFYIAQVVMDVSLAFSREVQFSWVDLPIMYSYEMCDMQFYLFYVFVEFIIWKYYKNLNNISSWFGHEYGVDKLKMSYVALNSACLNFNSALRVALYIRCGFDFLIVLIDLYVSATANYYSDLVGSMRVLQGLFSFMHRFWIVGTFLLINTAIQFESKIGTERIYAIQTKIGRNNLPYKSMELYLLKSKLNELNFSVCGFFPLDWTLIYSMVAGITTYLVYLIQFREMEHSRFHAQVAPK